MRFFALLVVLSCPLAVGAVTIEVPLTGLDGLYADGDVRISGSCRRSLRSVEI